ncbi:GTP-binding protein SAR1A [Dichanthelium oligosanthes]|uniref:GTP-binding protein SAR1A n=1 Tax=Dichanthelium oligosanthes TaxID=888268 RepID=A0A1E5WMN8_9POAL|nr:GTP-binding protein SAR1A [Dichanthelium oligosanthes]
MGLVLRGAGLARPVAEGGQDSLPRPRQRRQDHAAPHAQGRAYATPADASPDVGGAQHRQDQVEGLRPRRPLDRAPRLEGLLCKGQPRFIHLGPVASMEEEAAAPRRRRVPAGTGGRVGRAVDGAGL